jgi:glycerate dehydrogenase
MSTSWQPLTEKPRALFLNASRLDYDNKLDWSRLRSLCSELILHPMDRIDDVSELSRLLTETQPHIVIAKEMPIPPEVVTKHFPASVRLGCEAGTGFNNWPVKEARDIRSLPVCNIPTYSTEAVAHMAITYLMNFSVSMLQQQDMLRVRGDRANFMGPFTLPLRELSSQTLGLVGGAGRIGTKAAEIAVALSMQRIIISSRAGQLPANHGLRSNPNVILVEPYGTGASAVTPGKTVVECTSDVDYLLRESDYVSLHTPLNDHTRGSFGRAQISQMKKSAYLINTSRGAVCNEPELIACLQEQMIAGAGLDVTTTEPPHADSLLWNMSNVWLSPHTGWRRLETRQRLVDMTADNIESFIQAKSEKDIINVVN